MTKDFGWMILFCEKGKISEHECVLLTNNENETLYCSALGGRYTDTERTSINFEQHADMTYNFESRF